MAQKLAQPSFCAVLHSPVSENIRGALEKLSSGPKGRQTEAPRHRGTEASACVSDEAEFAEAASLTRGCAGRNLFFDYKEKWDLKVAVT